MDWVCTKLLKMRIVVSCSNLEKEESADLA